MHECPQCFGTVFLFLCAGFSIVAMSSGESAAELWAMLPRRFCAEYGSAGGLVPSACVLTFLVDSADDMASLVTQYAPGDAHLSNVARALSEQVQGDASATCKRRSLVDPAWQRVLLARRLPQSETTVPGLCDTLSWLRSKSGACRRRANFFCRAASNFPGLKTGSRVKLLTSSTCFIGGGNWLSWSPRQAYPSPRKRNSHLLPKRSL